jgi:hypothetical protein
VKRRRARIDGRFKPAIEIRHRIAVYSRAIGRAAKDPLTKARIAELAELEVLTSELRAAGLRGELRGSFELFHLSRFSNSCVRLRASLGLNAEPTVDSEYPELRELEKLLEVP